MRRWNDYNIVAYFDYYCPDKMSRIELLNMAKELNMDASSCTFSWFDSTSENVGFKEIASDADALTMATTVDSIREVNIYAKGNIVVESSGGAMVSDKRAVATRNRVEQNVDIH